MCHRRPGWRRPPRPRRRPAGRSRTGRWCGRSRSSRRRRRGCRRRGRGHWSPARRARRRAPPTSSACPRRRPRRTRRRIASPSTTPAARTSWSITGSHGYRWPVERVRREHGGRPVSVAARGGGDRPARRGGDGGRRRRHRCAPSLGTVDVLAHAAVIALCEEASCRAIAPALLEGTTTVGMKVGLDHLQPSGVGERVVAEAVLSKVEGRRLTFTVSASDAPRPRRRRQGPARRRRRRPLHVQVPAAPDRPSADRSGRDRPDRDSRSATPRRTRCPRGRPSSPTAAGPAGRPTAWSRRARRGGRPRSSAASSSRRVCRSRWMRSLTVFGSGTVWNSRRGPCPSGSRAGGRGRATPCGRRSRRVVLGDARPSSTISGDLVVVVLDLVADGGGPEADQGVRVGAVDGDLEVGDQDRSVVGEVVVVVQVEHERRSRRRGAAPRG